MGKDTDLVYLIVKSKRWTICRTWSLRFLNYGHQTQKHSNKETSPTIFPASTGLPSVLEGVGEVLGPLSSYWGWRTEPSSQRAAGNRGRHWGACTLAPGFTFQVDGAHTSSHSDLYSDAWALRHSNLWAHELGDKLNQLQNHYIGIKRNRADLSIWYKKMTKIYY